MTNEEKKRRGLLPRGLAGLIGFSTAVAAAWIFYSRRYIDHHAKVKGVLKGEEGFYESPTAGKIHFIADTAGSGRPVLVVHGIHLAAGLHDVAPIFQAFVSHRPVYVLDLPGFGGSQQGDRPYRPSMYQAAIADFIREKIGAPADVVVMGLTSEFAALAALADPDLFNSLTMINPTGFQMPQSTLWDKPNVQTLEDILYTLVAVPLWSLPLFDLLVNRPRLHRYYRRRFEYSVPDELVSIAWASAHQPGAHFAPLVYLCGKLYTLNVREKVYENLSVPVLVIYDNAPGLHFDMLPYTVHTHSNWKAKRIRRSRGMPHFDRPGEFFRALDDFFKEVEKSKA